MTAGPIWLGASYVLGREVRVDEPYPHICGKTITGAVTGRKFVVLRKDCAACGGERRLRVVKGGGGDG